MKKNFKTFIVPCMNFIRKVKSLYFQRNGVRGNSFYTAVVTLKGEQGDFIVTFESDRNDQTSVDIETVRCVSVLNPAAKWRGDEIGLDVESYLKAKLQPGQTIYDLLTSN